MSESSKVPKTLAQLALLQELDLNGGEGDTGDIVTWAMARFPYLQTAEAESKETPSGTPWWEGRFRFDLTDLKNHDEVENTFHGHWRITQKGRAKLKRERGILLQHGLLNQTEIAKDDEVMSEKVASDEDNNYLNLSHTDKLIYFWEQHSEGTKAEKTQQIRERIISLFLISKIKEIVDAGIVEDLWKVFDRDELINKIGSLSFASYTKLTPTEFGQGFDTLAQKLVYVFDDESLTYMERCLQVCQRIFGIYSIGGIRMYGKIREIDSLFERIWNLVDFEELFKLAGELCARGFISRFPYYEEFA